MLHPNIKFFWRLVWSVVFILMMPGVLQASVQPDGVVYSISIMGWLMFMLIPAFFK